jgi:membrane-associated PAP2 superfamily phosphatase
MSAAIDSPSPAARSAYRLDAVWLTGALCLLLAWEASALDLPVSQLFGNEAGFPNRELWFWRSVMHDAVRWPAWALLAWVTVQCVTNRSADRVLWLWSLGGVLLAMLAIQLLKRTNWSSCPWDLQSFGGQARYVPHWLLGQRDGGPGHCFPAGHASVAFGFLPMWAVWRGKSRWAKPGLALIVLGGAAMGLTQVVRGAHFVSHVFWTAWVCLLIAYALDALRRARHAA